MKRRWLHSLVIVLAVGGSLAPGESSYAGKSSDANKSKSRAGDLMTVHMSATGDETVLQFTDDSAAGVVIDPVAVTVVEGGSGTYSVVLRSHRRAT